MKFRQLSAQERARVFTRASSAYDLAEYIDLLREMEGDVAYGLEVNGSTPRTLKVRMNRAAKSLGLKLHWARAAKDAKELIAELAG